MNRKESEYEELRQIVDSLNQDDPMVQQLQKCLSDDCWYNKLQAFIDRKILLQVRHKIKQLWLLIQHDRKHSKLISSLEQLEQEMTDGKLIERKLRAEQDGANRGLN